MELNGRLKRYFTKALEGTDKTVYDLFEWKRVDVCLTNYATNEVITEMKDLEFPAEYSQTACDIIAGNYFRKKGIRNDRGYEYSMKELAHRMVSFWTEALLDEGIIEKEQKSILYDELVFAFLSQMWAPNSPQWFNTGLFQSYGINGPGQGHFYFDQEKGETVLSKDAYTRTQGSACFILSVKDSLMGDRSLTDQLTTETLLFKYGSGVGTNWSPIRAKNEYLSGGGKSSGLLSFLKVFDRNAGSIKSGGTTRRAAKMNILNLDHPEIMEYITWKAQEEDKVEALGKMGYSTSIDGEAYETVSGQNANNSIRIPNKFMKYLDVPNAKWHVGGRADSSVNKEYLVSDIWDKAAHAAWRCGDPGVQFDDTINAWHTCPAGEDGNLNAPHNRINASNPCSEYMFLDDSACNLASINIVKFYDAKSGFQIDGYLHLIMIIQLVLEATIHWGQFPTKEIARNTYLFRTTGLGLANMGALFMKSGLAYDSDEARNLGAALMSILTGYSYYTSALMAQKVGPFQCYETNKGHMKMVIRNHARAASYNDKDRVFENMPINPMVINHKVLTKLGFTNLSQSVKSIWKDTIITGNEYGYRNAQVSVLAPTGTIAFAMDCATTSLEPFFSHVTFKKLVSGGFMQIVNPVIPEALKRLGYAENEIEEIIKFVLRKDEKGSIADGKIENAPYLKEEHYSVFDTAAKCGTGQRYISPEGHVKMVGALTPHVSGAISKTVNMPNESSIDDVKKIYILAWELGVKAIALYRDGCKVCQPLSSNISTTKEKPFTEYSYQELLDFISTKKIVYKPVRVKLSGIRKAHVHEAAINGLKLYITTSFYDDGRLGEIYISSGREGSLTKGLLDSVSTTISEMLQYGVSPEDIARMYRGHKYEPSGFVTGHPYIKSVESISDLISKIIDIEMGNYTFCQVKPDNYVEAKSDDSAHIGQAHKPQSKTVYTTADYIIGEVCPNCKSHKLVKNGTCKVCTECGTTTGCS